MKYRLRAPSLLCSFPMVLVMSLWGCGSSATSSPDVVPADSAVPKTPQGPDASASETPSLADTASSAIDQAQTDASATDSAWFSSDSGSASASEVWLPVDATGPDGTLGSGDATASGCNLDGGPATLVRLSPQELKTILDSSEDPFLFNVKGTTIPNIPGTDGVFASDASGVEKFVGGDRCADIIVYCRSGVISQQVSAKLLADGYRRVRDLAGGILAWQAAGYPTK